VPQEGGLMGDFLKKTKGKVVVLTISILMGINWASNFLVFNSLSTKLSGLQTQVRAEKGKKDSLETLALLDKNIEKNIKELSKTQDFIPLIETVHAMTLEAGLDVVSIQPMDMENADHFLRLPLTIEGQCEYNTLGRFTSLIENHKPLLNIDSVQLSPTGDWTEGGKSIQFSVTLSSYVAKEDA
jgi:Tfp pilus assembly protein PilO